MFLLQDVGETICTAHASGASTQAIQDSMLSRQGNPCFSHCKVKLIVKAVLPATLLQTWLARHSNHQRGLKAEQPDFVQVVLLQCLQLFINMR